MKYFIFSRYRKENDSMLDTKQFTDKRFCICLFMCDSHFSATSDLTMLLKIRKNCDQHIPFI